MRKLAVAIIALGFLWISVQIAPSQTDAQEKLAPPVLKQANVHEFGCGPCMIINTLRFLSKDREFDWSSLPGDSDEARAKRIIDVYGTRDSTTYEGKQRFSDGFDGMSCRDTVATFQDLLSDAGDPFEISGTFLEKREGESLLGHLNRVHTLFKRSLDSGLPVPFAIRSFGAKIDEVKSRYFWYGLSQHFVTVVEVQEQLEENEKGFKFEFVDSDTGKREFGYICFDEARNFSAIKGNTETYEWLSDRPFLQVIAPSLRLQTNKLGFHQRSIMTANFGIFEKQIVDDLATKQSASDVADNQRK